MAVREPRIDPVEHARGLLKMHGKLAIKIVEALLLGAHVSSPPNGSCLAFGNPVEDGFPNKKYKTKTFWLNVLGYLRNHQGVTSGG